MSRPGTLSIAVSRICDGAAQEIALAEFLDNFYLASTSEARSATVADEPVLSGDAKLNALVAAIAEYLCKRYRLTHVPAWVSNPARTLSMPWFTTTSDAPELKEYLAFTSPAEFRHHNIFTEAVPLRRASQYSSRRA